jgi:hypothetical protein
MQKIPPSPHTLPPPQKKKPLFVVMMFSCKLKLWLEVSPWIFVVTGL